MPKVAILFGVLLIALGVVAYLGSDLTKTEDTQSTQEGPETTSDETSGKKPSAITGLAIPATFGVLLLASGLVGLQEPLRKHAMHGAVTVGLLGALATIGKGGFDVFKLATGQDVNFRAMTFVWIMALLCSVFVGLCVKSFIDARKRRESAAE